MLIRLTRYFKQNAMGNAVDLEGNVVVEKLDVQTLCPTCKQPIPRDATSPNASGSVIPSCDFCEKKALFIIRKRAVCYEHRDWASMVWPGEKK
jgi:NAD-dependent SIR2 family protein deacetylase